MKADLAAAMKALSETVAPMAAVARSLSSRARTAASAQWWALRQRLLDGDAIWGETAAAAQHPGNELGEAGLADHSPALHAAKSAPAAGTLALGSATTRTAAAASGPLRLCDWVDVRSRRMVVVRDVLPQRPATEGASGLTPQRKTSGNDGGTPGGAGRVAASEEPAGSRAAAADGVARVASEEREGGSARLSGVMESVARLMVGKVGEGGD